MSGDVKQMVVVGIDPALSRTGLCRVVDGTATFSLVVSTEPDRPRPERLIYLRDTVGGFISRSCAAAESLVVAMESQIWSSNPDVHSADAAVYGILQVRVWEAFRAWGDQFEEGQPRRPTLFVSVNPAHVKKWLGVKDKDQILLQVFKRYGKEFRYHDEADAFTVALIGHSLARYRSEAGAMWPEFTKPQIEVLDKLLQSGLPWEPQPPKPVKVKKGKR